MNERATVAAVPANQVLVRLWEMATADPRELVEIRVGACRNCWGQYHGYQYTEAEFERAFHEHVQSEAKRKRAEGEAYDPKPMREKGGAGYDAGRKPHPECPECSGRGNTRVILKDMRSLSPGARMLLRSVKVTKHGPQILLRSRLPALVKVGKHLGMWNDKFKPAPVNALTKLLDEIADRGSTIPIVHDDPELPPPRDAQDVEPEPAKAAPGAASTPVKRRYRAVRSSA
ncbi:hypothetical protein EZ313_17840 [Ramlibacter henchirensis]|uniref:Terminase small subunit n=1 Tax=Ramlibacter henchirensis TaxID=204072 RepID=A0A4Z0BYI0_9BURK|nr:terminase small subunit [Ramlibacter henchirensis]TFZ03075.1 hypothetical protein EZ313_17840 [Ramlibacter henchirensis]